MPSWVTAVVALVTLLGGLWRLRATDWIASHDRPLVGVAVVCVVLIVRPLVDAPERETRA
ncbi:MAG: hypothetical protein ABWX57_00120 [Aeromicrobium sp.]